VARDPITDLADAISKLDVESIAASGAKRIDKAIDRRFATGEAPVNSGKLRRNTVVDGASDGILIRNQLPYAEQYADRIVPTKPELQAEIRESFKEALKELPKW